MPSICMEHFLILGVLFYSNIKVLYFEKMMQIKSLYMKKTFYSLALALLMGSCASQPKQELY